MASDALIREIAIGEGIEYVLPAEMLCKGSDRCLFKDGVDYLYFDKGHFSFYGSRMMAEYIMRKIGVRN